jgi:hypothetical protein
MGKVGFWSEHEVEVLKEMYQNPKVSWDDLQKLFPARTKDGIKNKAVTLGLKRPPEKQSIVDEDYLKHLRKVIQV